jgi:transposase-like protein
MKNSYTSFYFMAFTVVLFALNYRTYAQVLSKQQVLFDSSLIRYDIGTGVPVEEVNIIKAGIELARSYLENFLRGDIPPDVRQTITVKIVATGRGNEDPGGGGACCTALDVNGQARPFFDVQHKHWNQSPGKFTSTIHKLKTAAHEYAHAWQWWLGGIGKRYSQTWMRFEGWLVEGAAEYVAYKALAQANYVQSSYVEEFMVGSSVYAGETGLPLDSLEYINVPFSIWPGHVGYLAADYLISKSPDSLRALRKHLEAVRSNGSLESQALAQAFQSGFGLSKASFYQQFPNHFASLLQKWNFPPAAPILIMPIDKALNVSNYPTLVWNVSTGATFYHVQVSAIPDFSTTVFDDSTITSTSQQVGPLANNTPYFWRVSAKNSVGTSSFSAARSFTTIVAAPTAPTLVSPADGATGVSTSPTLTWNASGGATTYRLQLSTDSTFASFIVNDSTLADTSKQVGPLANNTRYFWRVSAKNAGGTSPFSAARRFTTAAPSSVERVGSEVPAAFALSQNYPNPFNPSTTIRLQIPDVSCVRLMVYNVLGCEVATLVNENLQPGSYEVKFDASGLPSGVYLYRLEVGNFIRTRRMILIR